MVAAASDQSVQKSPAADQETLDQRDPVAAAGTLRTGFTSVNSPFDAYAAASQVVATARKDVTNQFTRAASVSGGVQAAAGSVQRKQYAEDRATTIYFLRNGRNISGSMERLQELNGKDRLLMKDTRAALEPGDTSRFNRLVAQAERNDVEQGALRQQVKDYQQAFDKAFLR